jgi:hypothetical protein
MSRPNLKPATAGNARRSAAVRMGRMRRAVGRLSFAGWTREFEASAARVTVIAHNTLLESARQRFLLLLCLVASAFGIAVWLFRDCGIVAPANKFLLDGGFGALAFSGGILAIVTPAQSFFGEIERRTVLAVMAMPVRRTEFILGKLAGIVVLLLVFCAAGTGWLLGMMAWQQAGPGAAGGGIPGDGGHVAFLAVVGCGLVQWLRCCTLAALTLLVSSYARGSSLALLSGFAALAICNLQSVARDACRIGGSGLARGMVGVAGLILPDFGLYDVADGVAAGGRLSFAYLAGMALYSAAYVGLFGGLAACCFRHREL